MPRQVGQAGGRFDVHHPGRVRLSRPLAGVVSTRCKVGQLLDTLEGDDLATLEREASQAATTPAKALALALTREGHKVGDTTVKDHRSDRCACARERTPA